MHVAWEASSSSLNFGQRVWNGHPGGGAAGDGRSPSSKMRWRLCSLDGSGTGMADNKPWVYGCIGWSKTSETSPNSTMRPRYMTATRLAMWRTTDRSWATKR